MIKEFYKKHEPKFFVPYRVLIYSLGILGALIYVSEIFAYFTGSNEDLAFSKLTWVDPFFILPAGLFFVLKKKEAIPFPFGWAAAFALALFVKHFLVFADPGIPFLRTTPIYISLAVAVYFSYLLPKNANIKKEILKQEHKTPIPIDYGKYPIQLDEEGKVFIPTTALDLNTHIMGNIGQGKTRFFIKPAIYQTIVRHLLGCFIYDVKSNMGKDVLWYVKQAKRESEFLYFDIYFEDDPKLINPIEYSMTWNPLAEGTPDEVSNRIFCALYYESDPNSRHYYELAYGVISELVALLRLEYPIINFQMMYDCLNDLERMKVLSELCQKHHTSKHAKYFHSNWLNKSHRQKQEELVGLINKLKRFCNREWSPLVNSLEPDIRMKDVIENNKILLFGVAANKYPDDARALSIMAIMNLNERIGSRLKTHPEKPFRVFLDEFYNMAYEKFIDIINKSREAGIDFFLSHQEFSDLARLSEHFARQASSAARNKIIFGIDETESAGWVAGVFGTVKDEDKKVFSYDTRDAVGSTPAGYTMPDGRKFRFGPDLIKELPEGIAFVKIRFKHGPEYYQLKMMDCVNFQAPPDFKIENFLQKRNNHKKPAFTLEETVTRPSLTQNRTPSSKNFYKAIEKMADEGDKKKLKPPSKEEKKKDEPKKEDPPGPTNEKPKDEPKKVDPQDPPKDEKA